jgi:hypothetical protein
MRICTPGKVENCQSKNPVTGLDRLLLFGNEMNDRNGRV